MQRHPSGPKFTAPFPAPGAGACPSSAPSWQLSMPDFFLQLLQPRYSHNPPGASSRQRQACEHIQNWRKNISMVWHAASETQARERFHNHNLAPLLRFCFHLPEHRGCEKHFEINLLPLLPSRISLLPSCNGTVLPEEGHMYPEVKENDQSAGNAFKNRGHTTAGPKY